jgi:DNA modification methylase
MLAYHEGNVNLPDIDPYFSTLMGSAYVGDALVLLKEIPNASIDLICTSPPFALLRQKAYGNVHADDYIEWFMQFAGEFARVLKPQGSLVIDIGGTWVKGFPVRSLYHYELLLKLCRPIEEGGGGFHLAQELYWYNPAKLPTPAEWVTIRRERVKDAVNTVWWLSLDPHPKADNRRVLKPYSKSQKRLMEKGYKAQLRPSQHDISKQFGKDNSGAIPPNFVGENVITASNTSSNDQYLRLCRANGIKPHPARFPQALPEFVIGLCTETGDLVLDPFAGSNMTGYVAESMGRSWLAFDLEEDYLKGSTFRFVDEPNLATDVSYELIQKNLFDGG